MNNFKALDRENHFLRPTKPYLLIYEDDNDELSVAWFKTEMDLKECIDEVKGYHCKIIDAIEIQSCRDIGC